MDVVLGRPSKPVGVFYNSHLSDDSVLHAFFNRVIIFSQKLNLQDTNYLQYRPNEFRHADQDTMILKELSIIKDSLLMHPDLYVKFIAHTGISSATFCESSIIKSVRSLNDIKNLLVKNGIDEKRITTLSYEESYFRFIVPRIPPENWYNNRTEVIFYRPE